MHGLTNTKFINAKQAGDTYSYRRVKRKLHKTTAAIWFNETCREKKLRPNYINIKINGNNRQCNNRTDHEQQHCYHHVPTVNQRLLLQLIGS
jgi:hypothetical protein